MTINHEDLNLDALEATARAATPGPWRWDENYGDPGDTGLALTNDARKEIVGAYNYHCCAFRDEPNVGEGDAEHIATFDPPTVLALIARLREAEARAENGPCWDEGFTVTVPRGECAPLPPLCTLKAGHLGAHQAGGATWTRRSAGGIERKLREAEAVIAEALEPKNIDYGHMDIALDRVRVILSRYKPTNQEDTDA